MNGQNENQTEQHIENESIKYKGIANKKARTRTIDRYIHIYILITRKEYKETQQNIEGANKEGDKTRVIKKSHNDAPDGERSRPVECEGTREGRDGKGTGGTEGIGGARWDEGRGEGPGGGEIGVELHR